MPFPQAVREQALVAAARYCCVCHRYKGVKVEVHHIVPEAQGGASDLGNAITLCFDCHSDAGHYNPQHPRGTKFSPSELRRHRDNWHSMVRAHAIQSVDAPDAVYCRYLLCKSFEAFREITLGDLSNLPVDRAFLVTNAVRTFQRQIVASHPESFRHDKEWGDDYADREAYSRVHPEVRLVERSSINLYPYFEAIRFPAVEELRERLAPRDAVSRLLIDSGVPSKEISFALAYDEVCGTDRFQEIYRLRPLWALYLAATNLDTSQVGITKVSCQKELPQGLAYRSFSQRLVQEYSEEALPSTPLPPGGTMLFPVATLLGPMDHVVSETISEQSNYLASGQGQVFAHEDLKVAYKGTALIGPAFWPRSVHLVSGALTREQPIHEFDLSNLYTIGRFWEAGSCPHLFAFGAQGLPLKYLGELFAHHPGKIQNESLVVAEGVTALVIAELEPELATIEEIRVNGRRRFGDMVLKKGDQIRFAVKAGDLIELKGQYAGQQAGVADPWCRNSLVCEFLAARWESMAGLTAG